MRTTKSGCSNLLREMELEYENESDTDISEDVMCPIRKNVNYTSTKRNLLSELEECVDTLKPN